MKGSYLLLMELKNNEVIPIGQLGDILFKTGFYLYVGSAFGGLEHRIKRHLRTDKKLHWHIDYLLRYARVIEIFYTESPTRQECCIAKKLRDQLGSIPGFGCSDCLCKSHLFYGVQRECIDAIIQDLPLIPYLYDANA